MTQVVRKTVGFGRGKVLLGVLAVLAAGALAVGLIAPRALAQGGSSFDARDGGFSIDAVHSHVGFRIMHMNAAWNFGRFNEFEGAFLLDADNPDDSFIDVRINVRSVDTNHDGRDNHLRNADFFNVTQFPAATFESTDVEHVGGDRFRVTGDFTLMGATEELTLDVTKTGESPGRRGGTVAGLYTEYEISRSDFGITSYPETLGDTVRMMVSLEGGRQ